MFKVKTVLGAIEHEGETLVVGSLHSINVLNMGLEQEAHHACFS